MKTIFCSIGLAGVLALSGACATMDHSTHQNGHNDNTHGGHGHGLAKGETAKAEMTANPANPSANAPVELTFAIRNPDGSPVKTLEVVHEKPMHLIVVSNDLEEFYHLHPEPLPDGRPRVSHTFPNGGDYRFYIDFKPQGGEPAVTHASLKVAGPERPAVKLTVDPVYEKTVDGLRVTMKPDGALKAGNDVTIDFDIVDAATGKPATNLEKYLGEYAHFVVVSEDTSDYLHVHPMSGGVQPGGASPSSIMAHTNFPKAGLYKVWAQFQRNGRIVTVPFVVKIE